MSQENVEQIRAVYDCWARGDFRAPAERLGADFEWRQVHGVVEPGSHAGQKANRALRSVFDVYDDVRVEPEDYVDAGDSVVVVARFQGTARGSGLHVDQRFAFVWTVRDGNPIRMEQYGSREAALKAVGLEE